MGKIRTKIIEGLGEEDKKSSAEEYAQKKAKKLSNLEKTAEEKTDKPKTVKQRGKKYLSSKAKVNSGNLYKLEEAVSLIKEFSSAKFDETMELHLVVRKSGYSVNVTLPHQFGKQKKVEIANNETLKKLEMGKIDFDVLLATPEMMPKLAPHARFLGPKGLMPNPKNGTIIKTEKDAAKFNSNSLNLKTEKGAPLIHTSFGKLSQDTKELVTNATAIIDAIGGSKQIIKAFMKSTMSPSIKVQI